MELGLTGRTAYVTGGANGLGEAIVNELIAEGVQVVTADLDGQRLGEREVEWRARGDAATVVADLATRAGAEGAARKAVELLGGPPDILINNVGRGFTQPFAKTSDEDWLGIFELNFFSHVRATRIIVPQMAQRGSGCIVNMASDLGKQPEISTATYSATKAAILSMTKTLALEYAPAGLRVNAVCPGPILTSLWTRAGGVLDELSELYGVDHDRALERFVGDRKIPLGIGEPRDVASLVAFLVSPRAKHMTGCAYDVNGGSVRGLL